MRYLIILLLVTTGILRTSTIQGQDVFERGYIITTEGERIEGDIFYKDWSLNPKLIKFKNGSSETELDFYGVIEFGLTTSEGQRIRYIARTVDLNVTEVDIKELPKNPEPDLEEQRVFLRQLVSGEASLYVHKGNENRINYFIEKDEQLIQLIYVQYEKLVRLDYKILENNQYKSQLQELLSGCDKITFKDVNDLKFEQKPLVDLINKFNRCEKATEQFVRDDRIPIKVNYEIYACYGAGKIDYKGDFPSRVQLSENHFEPLMKLGGNVNKYFRRGNLKFGFVLGAEYSPIVYKDEALHSTNNSAIKFNREYDLIAHYLRVKPVLRVALLRAKSLSIEFDAGFNIGILMANKNDYTETLVIDGNPGTVQQGKVLDEVNNVDFGLATGLNFSFTNYSVKLMFERSLGLLPGTYTAEAPLTVIAAGIGYRIIRDDRL